MKSRIVYADNAATTALSDTAFEQMLPYFKTLYGNASSAHWLGAEAKKAVEASRRRIATAINAWNNEIYFTSGGSESDNWALYGVMMLGMARKKHLITTAVEHSAIYRTAQYLETQGCTVTYLSPDDDGIISENQLRSAIRNDTALVSVMLANNEIGTILPIAKLCAVARERRVLFHTDAVQAVGHIPVDVKQLNVDMLSLSAHKFGGPKGVGALYVRLGVKLPPLIIGGGQEKNRRSGTENTPGIVGMAAALEESVANMCANVAKVTAMRDRLIEAVLYIDGARLTGHRSERLPGIASFIFSGLASKAIVAGLSDVGIYASSGSACSSGSTELSRALTQTAVIDSAERGAEYGALRISLNEHNTDEDVDYIIRQLPIVIASLKRAKTPL